MLRRRADCNITVLHCVIYIMEVRRVSLQNLKAVTEWYKSVY